MRRTGKIGKMAAPAAQISAKSSAGQAACMNRNFSIGDNPPETEMKAEVRARI
jgi:hypothetical protein